MRSELSVGRLSLAGKSQNLSIQHTRLGWLITHAWLMGTRHFLFTVYMKTCTCTHTACTVHICSHVASRARTHTLARTPIKGNPEKKLKGRISLPSFTLPLYLKKNGGFEEALWSEVYHLRSFKNWMREELQLYFYKCPEGRKQVRRGKISQHSWHFFTEL